MPFAWSERGYVKFRTHGSIWALFTPERLLSEDANLVHRSPQLPTVVTCRGSLLCLKLSTSTSPNLFSSYDWFGPQVKGSGHRLIWFVSPSFPLPHPLISLHFEQQSLSFLFKPLKMILKNYRCAGSLLGWQLKFLPLI